MNSILIRIFGLGAQIITAFRLITLFDIDNYGKYVVYIFETNILSVFLSFGVISFNINTLAEKKYKEFYENSAQVIMFSLALIPMAFFYFFLKYELTDITMLLLFIIIFKVLQNICYSGILGEKGINDYNLYLNSQLIIFMVITFIPNISIKNLLFAWLFLTALNIVLLRRYLIFSSKHITFKAFKIKKLSMLTQRSLYDFNSNFTNRYELLILSFFEQFSLLVGMLSVFMQIGDSLVNFFKTLAPKIQITALSDSKKTKKLHAITFLTFGAVIIVLVFTFEIWMKYLKPQLLNSYLEYIVWSFVIFLSVVLWSYKFELQSRNFNITKFNFINISLLIIVCLLTITFANDYYILVLIRALLLITLICYTFNLSRKKHE